MMPLSKFFSLFSMPIRIVLLEYLRDNEMVTLKAISECIFGSPSNLAPVRYHLQLLCDNGFCKRVQIGRRLYYTAVPMPELAQQEFEQFAKLFPKEQVA